MTPPGESSHVFESTFSEPVARDICNQIQDCSFGVLVGVESRIFSALASKIGNISIFHGKDMKVGALTLKKINTSDVVAHLSSQC